VAATVTAVPATTSGTAAPKSSASISYISPHVQYDAKTHLEITQYRDPETGKVRLQIPAEKVVEAYRRIASYGAAAQTSAASLGLDSAGKAVTADTSSNTTVANVASPSVNRVAGVGSTAKAATVTESNSASATIEAAAALSAAIPSTVTPQVLLSAETSATPVVDTTASTAPTPISAVNAVTNGAATVEPVPKTSSGSLSGA